MDRIPLYYTFGNHMHWVDMEWLWGYHVLPGCIRDMLHFCKETGAKGNVNFEGIGYEKLAAEDPEALNELRKAVLAGQVEPVGCSYGQPYGLFHGGESNLRQRVYGARAVRRLLGVWPKTFWEEEFDFFPQLPQLLKGCGFEYASLFFQWTWHTPEVPKEEEPVVWWEGQDGSRLLCATRNKLNLHQWPEDMEATFAELWECATQVALSNDPESATRVAHSQRLILQWLELMPSPDWMCRSEVLLPKMRELLADERFEIRMATLGGYLSQAPKDVPTRRYSMDQVWHGMSLGKNGDLVRKHSREAESSLLSAETISAICGLFGRPYAQWDVYPTWELEEGWRELLSAQHHDNDECEGLCGHVGIYSYERSKKLSKRVLSTNLENLARRFAPEGARIRRFGPQKRLNTPSLNEPDKAGKPQKVLVVNPLGWEVPASLEMEGLPTRTFEATIPAFGCRLFDTDTVEVGHAAKIFKPEHAELSEGELHLQAALAEGKIKQITSPEFPEGVFSSLGAFGFILERDKARKEIAPPVVETYSSENGRTVGFRKVFDGIDDITLDVRFNRAASGFHFKIYGHIAKPAPGMKAGLQTSFNLGFKANLVVDHPYGVSEVKPIVKGLKKYPEGDWMTSPQWFEEVHNPFTALNFVDLVDSNNPDRGLLIVHNGNQQWFLDVEENRVRCLLSMYDPWDEDYFVGAIDASFLLIPHGPITNSQRWKIAQQFLRFPYRCFFEGETDAPESYSALSCSAPNVIPAAFYRETEDYSGKHVENYAGRGMEYPYVLRLVEFDGLETEATLTVAGTVAKAFKTNHLGQVLWECATQVAHSQIKVQMRPYEIATVYLDIVEGRKQTRDLDAKREIWATVHRVD